MCIPIPKQKRCWRQWVSGVLKWNATLVENADQFPSKRCPISIAPVT